MKSIVYEYFLDNENYILGWQQWPEDKRPDLKNNPFPLPQMYDTVKDENRRLLNKANKNFKLENNQIEIIPHEKSDDEYFDGKYSVKEALRRIVKGVKNSLDPDFVEFMDDIEKTVRRN